MSSSTSGTPGDTGGTGNKTPSQTGSTNNNNTSRNNNNMSGYSSRNNTDSIHTRQKREHYDINRNTRGIISIV